MYSTYDKLFFDRTYIKCPCGSIILSSRYSNHFHSKKHTNYERDFEKRNVVKFNEALIEIIDKNDK
tara:strand:- start:425 stop:622 length:198 start_codon:yes stop_codon:yes gene_type:complete